MRALRHYIELKYACMSLVAIGLPQKRHCLSVYEKESSKQDLKPPHAGQYFNLYTVIPIGNFTYTNLQSQALRPLFRSLLAEASCS